MKRKGVIWLMAGLVLAIVAGLATFKILAQASATAGEEPGKLTQMTNVVVALVDIGPRTILTDTALSMREVPVDVVPEGAVTTLDEARGKLTLDALTAGEMIMSRRLANPTNTSQHVSFTMPEDKVAIALPGGDRLTKAGVLKTGDKVDLLFSLDTSASGGDPDTLVTLPALQNLEITALIMPGLSVDTSSASALTKGPTAGIGDQEAILLVAVDPQDALVIKYLIDAGAVMDLALRPAASAQTHDMESVSLEYMADRFQFEIKKGSTQPSRALGE